MQFFFYKLKNVIKFGTKTIKGTDQRTAGWASSIARINVVPDLGTPPEIF